MEHPNQGKNGTKGPLPNGVTSALETEAKVRKTRKTAAPKAPDAEAKAKPETDAEKIARLEAELAQAHRNVEVLIAGYHVAGAALDRVKVDMQKRIGLG